MNFFEHQAEARQKTSWLLFLYFCAVIAVILAIALPVSLLHTGGDSVVDQYARPTVVFNGEVFAGVTAIVAVIILCGSLWKGWTLRNGGGAIAESLGGRLVASNSTDANERRLLNVVEEISLAAGIAVPAVYVLDAEGGINAFAAGKTAVDPVIGVTRGTLEQLSREELQGVIAHEFSHIFNGDMRLNLRLVQLLSGITLVSTVGYILLRSSSDSRRSRREKGGGQIALIGLILYVMGYVGSIAASLIRAAVSRQREFLADATAVQYTRNPSSISGALRKIASSTSTVQSPQAQETAHFFFSQAFKRGMLNLFATHPALPERIARIEGRNPGITYSDTSTPPTSSHDLVSSLTSRVGTVTTADMQASAALLSALPEAWLTAAHEPSAARAVIATTLLHKDPEIRAKQLRLIAETNDALLVRDVHLLIGSDQSFSRGQRLALASVAVAALRSVSRSQYLRFRELVRALIEIDNRYNLFEYALQRMLQRHLDRFFLDTQKPNVEHSQSAVALAAACVLRALAHFTQPAQTKDQAFRAATMVWGAPDIAMGEAPSLEELDRALNCAGATPYRTRERLVRACVTACMHDQSLNDAESELLRAIIDALECPLPRELSQLHQ